MNKYVLETTNNDSQFSLKRSERPNLRAFLEANAIEKHSAWKGKVNQEAVADFLADQCSFTYVLSQDIPNEYFLSYIRGYDRKVIHIHFKVIFDRKLEQYRYRNHNSITFSSLNALIRYKIKGRGVLPKDALLRISA